jgi:hypothetical protein
LARARRALVGMGSDFVRRLPPVSGVHDDPVVGGAAAAGK